MRTLISLTKSIAVLICILAFLNNCKKEKVKVTDIPKVDKTIDTTGTVYAAGYRSSANLKKVALYWREKSKVILCDSANNSEATDIEILNSVVHVCGYRSTGSKQLAVYWNNKVETILSSALNDASATSLALSGSDIYVTGYETNGNNIMEAKYWKNGLAITLTDGKLNASANAITVIGTDVYVAGYEYNNAGVQVAKYWKNGVAVTLSDGTINTSANSIAVGGSDVHIAGASYDAGSRTYTTKYWKNTDVTDLNSGSSGVANLDIYGNAVFLNNGNVYVGGNSVSGANSTKPTYWKNGTAFVNFSSASYFHQVTSIYVLGGKVYLGGFGNYFGNGPNLGMVWTAGAWRGMEFSSAITKVNSLYVVN